MTDLATHEPGSILPRQLVPTSRQVEEGAQPQSYAFEAPPPRQRLRLHPGAAVRTWLREADPRTIEGPKLPLAVLALGAFFGSWDDVAFAVLSPEIRAEFGVSFTFTANLALVIIVVTNLSAPLMGWLADRVKRVWMVRTGAVLANLSSVAAGMAGSVSALVGTRFTAGLAQGITQPAGLPLLTDYYPTRARGRVFASLFAFGAVGAVIGPTLAGRIADAYGWRATMIVLGSLATFVSLGAFLLREPTRGAMERTEQGLTADAAAVQQPALSFGEGWRAARSIGTVRRLWIAAPILALGTIGTTLILTFYWAEVFLLGPQGRGYLATTAAAMGLLGLVLSGPLTDRMLRDRPGRVLTYLGIAVVVQGIAFVGLSYSPSLWLSIAILLPVGFVSAIVQPGFVTVISLVIPPRLRAFGMQTTGWFTVIGLLALPQLVGLSNTYGLRKGLLFFVPLFVFAGFVIMSAAGGVDRDIRNSRSAAVADQLAEEARRSGNNKMLIIRDLDVVYDGGVQVLFGVDLDIDEGEILALLGTNGAGKSTLLKAIAGIHEATNGAILLDGRDITHAPPYEAAQHGVVMMPGGHAVFPTLTVAENLHAAAWLYSKDEAYCRERTEEVLTLFPRLRERWDQQAGNLSGGEQQMVGLGQALLMKPRLLLVDELSLGLAPAVVEELLEVLRTIAGQGTTVVIVEQSVNVALRIAERAVFMEKGEIQYDGPTSELLAQPALVRSIFMGQAAVGGKRRRVVTEAEEPVVLSVSDVSVRFGGIQALSAVDLEVRQGEIVGIIGPNGAGKTTLFDVISGFVPPSSGAIVVAGHDVTRTMPEQRAQLGLARSFQRAQLFPALTVRENIAIAYERKTKRNAFLAAAWAPNVRKSEAKIFSSVDGLIELLGLEAFANKFVGELSTGSRRAVDVACIMALDPKVLLLDEPSTGLAQAETEELGPVITRLVRDTGCGVLLIEHDLPLIMSISDRLVAMELGRVVATGTPQEVTTDPRVLASYLAADAKVIARSDSTSQALADALASPKPTTRSGGKGR